MRSLSIALRKRPVEPERVEEMVSKIVRELESIGESEITSETIGEAVMEQSAQSRRRRLCAVCLGLSSNFREPKDFEQALAELSGEDEPKNRPSPSRPNRPSQRENERRGTRASRSRARERRARSRLARFALHAACAGARPPRARPHLAQSGGRRGHRQGRRDPRPRLDPTGRPAARRDRGAQARRQGGQGRDALRDARAVLASGQDAALRRRHHPRRHRPRRLGAGRPQSGGGGAGLRQAPRARHRGRDGPGRRGGGAPARRAHPPDARRPAAGAAEARGVIRRQGRAARPQARRHHRRAGARCASTRCAPNPTPSWSASARCCPTIRISPAGCRA